MTKPLEATTSQVDSTAKKMSKFAIPKIEDNPTGWGPTEIASEFKDIPYQPYSKGDRLGKISDWTGQGMYGERRYNNRFQQFGVGGAYTYYHDEDESNFQLVDTKNYRQSNRFHGNRRFARGQRSYKDVRFNRRNENMQQLSKGQQPPRSKKSQWSNRRYSSNPRRGRIDERMRESSVEVRSSWSVVEEIQLSRLNKLSLPVQATETLKECGEVECYNKAFDKVTTKFAKPLLHTDRIFHNVSTTDDPEIRNLLESGNVFATDAILAAIMCSPRSVYSWDLIIERVEDKMFIEKRPSREEVNSFDLLTVNETSSDPPKEDVEEGQTDMSNTVSMLSKEATYINQNFSQQVLSKKLGTHKFKNPNPFADQGDDVASVGYRYKKFDLGEGRQLVARCEVNGVIKGAKGNKNQFLTVKSLNEFDPKTTGFMRKLDSQRGAVLATELKNNSYKLAKWTMCSLLADADQIKLGYVTRADPKDNQKHMILGTQYFKPKELATQINLNTHNAWGILRYIIDIALASPPGKYCLLKDPNKPVLRLYSIPQDTFESDLESDEENPFQPMQQDESTETLEA